jgi:hypothetical protein
MAARASSFARGGWWRAPEPKLSLQEEYEQTQIMMAKNEEYHFEFGSVRSTEFLAELKPVIKSLAKGGIRKPRDVAKSLNRFGKFTACGEHWTPRLAWLLLHMLFNTKASPAIPKLRSLLSRERVR